MIQKIQAVLLLLTGLFILSPTALAESLYVADTLRIGVRTDTSSDAASVSVIVSGAQVDVLEQKGNMVKIKTENGAEGWVKSAYLTNKKPAVLLLREANEKIRKLENEIQGLKSRPSMAGGDASVAVSNQIEQLEADKSSLLEELETLRGQTPTNDSAFMDGSGNSNIIYWIIGSLVVILSLGFLFGVTWHKHQVMKRLGGLSL